MKRENGFQAELIKELKAIFSNAVILKNDSSYLQGIPDLSIFVGNKWAFLECKTKFHFYFLQTEFSLTEIPFRFIISPDGPCSWKGVHYV